MIRAVCPESVADLKTGFVTGWNITPNVQYTISVYPGATSVAVWLFDAASGAYVAGGAALVGTDQPLTLLSASSPGLGMVDADLGYHLLVTSDGTEPAQTYSIGPFVDSADHVSAMYTVDNIAVAQAAAVIREGTHYVDDVSILCPLGVDAWLGDVCSATVHGESMVGDIESVSFQAGPSSMADVVTLRRMSAILPDDPVVIVQPVITDDAAETDAATATSGNVLTNDASGLTVVAVDGLESNVGTSVAGSAGGVFTIAADGVWTFDPHGAFATLSGSDTAETSITYHASNGLAEAMATLTVTVSSGAAVAWTPNQIPGVMWITDEGVVHDYNGTSDYTVTSAPALDCPTSLFFALVTDSIASERTILNQQYGDVKKPWQLYFSSTGRVVDWRTGASSPAVSVGVPAQICEIQSAIASVVMYKDGSSTGGTVGTTATGYAASAPIYVGKSQAYGAFGWYDGRFISGFVVPSAVDTETRQKCEGYLAHTVDVILGVTTLVDALPSGHPYKLAPPTV